jgi:hypothetical protein
VSWHLMRNHMTDHRPICSLVLSNSKSVPRVLMRQVLGGANSATVEASNSSHCDPLASRLPPPHATAQTTTNLRKPFCSISHLTREHSPHPIAFCLAASHCLTVSRHAPCTCFAVVLIGLHPGCAAGGGIGDLQTDKASLLCAHNALALSPTLRTRADVCVGIVTSVHSSLSCCSMQLARGDCM